jgi:pimeloyl-ACP methyl ester carboxylesterase
MATLVLVHGAWGSPQELSPVEPALTAAGHRVVIVDLPCGNPTATLEDYARTVIEAIGPDGDDRRTVLVGHSFGGATISLVREQRPDVALVFVTAVVLEPGQSLLQLLLGGDLFTDPGDDGDVDDPWRDLGGLVRSTTPGMCELDLDVMAAAAPEDQRAAVREELARTQRPQGVAVLREGWPGRAVPNGRTSYVIATSDTLIPPELQGQMADALGAHRFEVASDHQMFAEQPAALAQILLQIAAEVDATAA